MKKIAYLIACGITALSLSACEAPENDGPAENAGEAVDNAAKEAGKAMEEAGEDMQEKADGH